ncbi:MAG: glycosyltransferase [Flavobacteriales bacterium]|nr:glycosyltransferase [Flavobacteriales bacterium]
MRVLFFTHWFPTEGNPQKGIFILEQAKALKSVGASVTIVHVKVESGKGLIRNTVSSTEMEGIPVVTVDLSGALWKLIYTFYPIQLLLVRKALRKAQVDLRSFDVLHSHVIHPAGAIGNRLAQENGLPFYISEHWSNLAYYFEKNLFRNWGKEAYANARKIFVVSKFLKERTAKFVAHKEKLAVVPNVVSADEFKFRPSAIGSSYYFVMAAKWNRTKRVIKRPKLLIKAVAEASKELDKPVILGIIGDGDRVPELKKFCLQNDVHAQFFGFISKETIAKEFQKADLFLHGSEYETFSVVIAEALKCGTPVVASNVCAIPELIDDSNGILVENQVAAWKDAIVQAMHNRYEKQEIAESFKTKFGYNEVGEMLLEAYRNS